jgi:hypothetical protein
MSNNGHGPTKAQRKRIEEQFTFESTGVVLSYTRVPLQLIIDFESGWKRKNPTPVIPQVETDIGGEKKTVSNPTDPDYQLALSEWEAKLHNASYRYMLKKAIVLTVGDLADVAGLRREVEEAGSELDPDDAWVFLFNIASPDPEEIGKFQDAILRLSQPTKESVDDAKARFQDNVLQT